MSAPAAGFDPAIAAELEQVLGTAGVARLMAAFAAELAERPARIAALIAAGDVAAARFQAHYLKGAAASIGATALAAAATAVEHGAEGDLPTLAARLAECAAALSV